VGSNDLSISRYYFVRFWITYQNWAANKNVEVENKDNNVAVIRVIILNRIKVLK
jgi:hypothetical protein